MGGPVSDMGERIAPAYRSLDALLRFMFSRGVAFGARYPEESAIPEAERELQFLAAKDHVMGNTWSPQQWEEKRKSAYAAQQIRKAETDAGLR